MIPTLDHYGHEVNSQIFLTIYFCTRFFLRQEILHQHFLNHKILHIYFGGCFFFVIKSKCTNICDTHNGNAKNFDSKYNVAKEIHKNFCGFIFATTIFVSKVFV